MKKEDDKERNVEFPELAKFNSDKTSTNNILVEEKN